MRVAIVGAGPAGCAAAIELCRLGAEVVLLSDGRDGIGEQMPPEARPLLQQLGLLPLDGHLDCVGVRAAWRTETLSHQAFVFRPFGNGWLLDRRAFGAQMRQRAVNAGAVLRQPVRLLALARSRDWRLCLEGDEVACDWIIDASGRHAAVARRLGIRRRRFDRQFAVVGWLQTEADDEDATLTVERGDRRLVVHRTPAPSPACGGIDHLRSPRSHCLGEAVTLYATHRALAAQLSLLRSVGRATRRIVDARAQHRLGLDRHRRCRCQL